MSEKTKISWCDSTWSPIKGCSKVSPGCANCYITRTPPLRIKGWKFGDPIYEDSERVWNEPFKWNKKPWICECQSTSHLGLGTKCWQGHTYHRRRIFATSLSDWLHPNLPVATLARFLDTIRRCQDCDFLLCTKRPELFVHRLQAAEDAWAKISDSAEETCDWCYQWWTGAESPRNIWVLTSAEDQKRADERIPHLLKIPAVVRGLSCEPLIEPLDLKLARPCDQDCQEYQDAECPSTAGKCVMQRNHVGWVIVGGESGKDARPCNVEWIRSIRDQCQAAVVPVFVKQLGSNSTIQVKPPSEVVGGALDGMVFSGRCRVKRKHPKGGDPSEWPEDLRVQQFPQLPLPHCNRKEAA